MHPSHRRSARARALASTRGILGRHGVYAPDYGMWIMGERVVKQPVTVAGASTNKDPLPATTSNLIISVRARACERFASGGPRRLLLGIRGIKGSPRGIRSSYIQLPPTSYLSTIFRQTRNPLSIRARIARKSMRRSLVLFLIIIDYLYARIITYRRGENHVNESLHEFICNISVREHVILLHELSGCHLTVLTMY